MGRSLLNARIDASWRGLSRGESVLRIAPPAGWLLSAMFLTVLVAAPAALAQDGAPPAAAAKASEAPVAAEPKFRVTEFIIEYGQQPPHPKLPDLKELRHVQVALGRTPEGYVTPRKGVPVLRMRLGDLSGGMLQDFHAGALLRINQALVRWFNINRKVVGVYVAPHAEDIREETTDDGQVVLKDIRGDRTSLRIVVWIGVVGKLRTIASGSRIPAEDRIDSAKHKWIVENSPIRPAGVGAGVEKLDLLRRDQLDDYVLWLSRHPGRRVDVAVAAAGQERGEVALDFLVSENKPWLTFFQMSNTGTKDTGKWRQRLGFVHNQLSGNDDILTIDYTTANFDDSQALSMRYERPIAGLDRVRWSIHGSWDSFTASDVGQSGLEYTGEGFSFGADLAVNIFQHRELFIDAIAGVKCRHVEVDNKLARVEGSALFLLPHVGLRAERTTDTANTYALLDLEWTVDGCHSPDTDDLTELGRLEPEETWAILRWDASHSFFLEPVLRPEQWRQPDSPWATLAHEVALAFRGQCPFDSRLVAHAEQTIGGMYTVRGYPESLVAGDTAIVANAEYRWHIPNSFNPMTEDPETPSWTRVPARVFGQKFQVLPRGPYGRADWDLIFRAFFDVGRTMNSDRLSFEENETLMGTGIGVELKVKQNLSLRVDWGVALRHGDSERVEPGDNRFHVVGTLMY